MNFWLLVQFSSEEHFADLKSCVTGHLLNWFLVPCHGRILLCWKKKVIVLSHEQHIACLILCSKMNVSRLYVECYVCWFQGQSMYPGTAPMGGMPPSAPGQHGMGPHAPMNSPMQQQRRIDPDQMPSPVSTTLHFLIVYLLCAWSTFNFNDYQLQWMDRQLRVY